MDDRWRLYPGGFIEAYYEAFGGYPPEEFLESYELLADSFYFGLGLQPERPTGKFKGNDNSDAFFKEPRLLNFKFLVDRRLARAAQAIRTWTAERACTEAGRHVPAPDRGVHLAQDRGSGDSDPDAKEAGAS